MTVLDDLTDRQRALLDALRRLHDQKGYPPSVRELGWAVGLSSTASVYRHVRILAERGLVEHRAGTHRTLRIREGADPLAMGRQPRVRQHDA
jgi:repressor LexA